ncbi:MAG: molybdate ABC transporter permease subunit [Alphaproteobacteria bacterium]
MGDWLGPAETEALWLSLRVAAVATLVSVPLGVGVAWVIVRSRLPGRGILNAIVHVPLVLPPVVVGYVLLLAFGRRGWIGGWLHDTLGIEIAFTWVGAAVAAGVLAFPLLVRAVRLSLEAVDGRLEQAARTLGAGRADAFRSVTLPLMLPGIVTGSILAFARCLGEFGATVTFVGNIPGETQTLPLLLFQYANQPDREDAALRIVIVSLVVAFAALFASELLARRVARRIGQR